jgi:hypothetical protein
MGKVVGAVFNSVKGPLTGLLTGGTKGALQGLGNLATAFIGGPAAVAASVASNVLTALSASAPSTKDAATSVTRQSTGNSYIIYGKRRVGGLLCFFHPVGKDYRYFVIAVAGHRCKGVTRWYLGDEEVTVNSAGKVTSGKYANNAWLWFARGTDDQVANSTFVAETQGKWTANHRARGTALIYAKFKMVDDVVQAGMPNITAEVEGKDDIADPRTGTIGYTRNAALIFYDWMRLPREEGGFGAYEDELDDDWISAQANVCSEICNLQDGSTEARYEMDCYITTGAAPSEVRDTLVTCCAGSFTYTGGKMLMRPGYYVPPSATLQERDLAGAINVPALLAGDQTSTEMTGTYVDPANLYQPRDVPTRSIDSDDVRQSSLDLPHITSGTRAQRILEIALRKSLAERRVTWPMNIVGIGVATLDTVQLATARYGLSNYAFQVSSWGLSSDFSVVLQLEETSPQIFEFTPAMYKTVGATGELVPAEPISDAPQAIPLDAPTEFSGAQSGPLAVKLDWRNPKSSLFDHIAIVRNGVESATPIVGGLGAALSATDNPPSIGSYTYLIRAFSTDGASTMDSPTITVVVS